MATINEILDRIEKIGSGAVGLTDHGVISGHLEFGKKAMERGIKPVFGIEAYQARDHRLVVHKLQAINPEKDKSRKSAQDTFHLILLAKNDVGFKNIWKLSSLAYLEGYAHGKPRLDLELLEAHKEGIIATSACLGSKTVWDLEKGSYQSALDLATIFGENWFIELHTYESDHQKKVNIELVSMADKYGWPLVYATDAHYACESDAPFHDVFNTMTQNTVMSNDARLKHPPCLWIQDEDDIRANFSYLPKSRVDEAIKNSVAIAEMCDVSIPKPHNRIPCFFPDQDKKYARKFLIKLIEEQFEERYEGTDQEEIYLSRLEKELEVILEADLVDFFLIEWDVMRFAKEQGIVTGPGRGSVGGSLVAYLLGITDIDPIRFNLIFERFYNKGREKGGMPDIDTDFPTSGRAAIKEYMAQKYGENHVSNLGTMLRLHGKSVIDRVGKVLEINYSDIIQIKAIVDETTDAGLMASWEDIIEYEPLQPWVEKYPQLFEMAGKFHGRIFTYGIHASGFLVSNEPLNEIFPLKKVKGEISTQFDMHEAAAQGFMKIDFLALKNLDILIETKRIIKEKRGIDWDFQSIHHESDEKLASLKEVWRLFDLGLTVGLFQVEDGQAAKSIAKEMKCRSIEDLSILVALNRPGPLRGGMVGSYLKARVSGEWDSPNEVLDDILAPTLGTFIYQEQVIQYMTALGFDLETADEVRSFIGKKKVDKMEAFYPIYMEKASEVMDSEIADSIWQSILDFAKYGFNKAHSIGYAIILLWTAYAKAYYPAEYLLACLRIDTDDKKRYIAEALRMGIKVMVPQINESMNEADLIDGKILMGFSDVKGINNSDWIIENRPFESYEQALEVHEEMNKQFLALKKEGLVEGPSPKQKFSSARFKALYNVGAFDSLEKRDFLSKKEKRAQEKELLGVILDNDGPLILDKHAKLIEKECDDYDTLDSVGEYIIAGSVSSFEKSKTRNNSDMAWITLDNKGKSIRIAAFGKTLLKNEDSLQECCAILAEVKKTERGLNLIDVLRLR